MKFSVLVPTYNRREILFLCLESLFAQTFPAAEFEVIVAVDGSSDGTIEMLRDLRPSCRLRTLYQPNRGLPSARNLSLRAAEGDIVLILDDDIICHPLLLQTHWEEHASGTSKVVFGPVPLHPNSSTGVVSELWAEWCDRFFGGATPGMTIGFATAAVAPAVNRSVPRHVLNALGGCDETLKDCHEDWDLGIRLWKAGVPFFFRADAIAYHLYHKNEGALINDATSFAVGELALSRKHFEYRPYSVLAKLGSGRFQHRLFAEIACRLPFDIDPALRPISLALSGSPAYAWQHRVSVRLIGWRYSLRTYRQATKLAGSPSSLRSEFGHRLPVLAYHHVGEAKAGSYPDLCLAQRFERHVRWLYFRGYNGIDTATWLNWIRHGVGLPAKPVLLTFDDAYEDIATIAIPILRRYGFGATVFVPTAHVGGTNAWDEARQSAIHPLMTLEQIRHLADHGVDFGAHGHTHLDLTSLSSSAAAEDIRHSRDTLAAVVGKPVTAFAYPYGSYNPDVRQHVATMFELAFTTDDGLNHLSSDSFLLKRISMGRSDSVVDVEIALRFGHRPVARARKRLRLSDRLRRRPPKPADA